MHPKIAVRKRSAKGTTAWTIRRTILGAKSIKHVIKNDAKIDAEKVMKIDEKSSKNDAKIDVTLCDFLMFFAKVDFVKNTVFLWK